jgi:hypothetical protein
MAAKPKPKKRTTSSRSIRLQKKKRGISRLQALILVAALAAIGVVAVALTRASGTPDYQYSWNKYCVSAYGKDSAKEVADCKDKSAESMVYRLYRGLFDKGPDVAGYKFWTQKLAGDRIKVVETSLVSDQVAKMGSDTAFVKALYRNMLGREAKESEMISWRNRLKETGSKKWSREKMVYSFAITDNAIAKNRDAFNSYARPDRTVTVVQTAAANQRKRFDAMLIDYKQPNISDMESAAKLASSAEAELKIASATAGKKSPTSSDLESIAANQAAAESYYVKSQSYVKSTSERAAAAQRLYDRAEQLASYATDIGGNSLYGISKIESRYKSAKEAASATASKPANIKKSIEAISSKYAVAEKKFRTIAEAAAKTAKNSSQSAGAPQNNSLQCPPTFFPDKGWCWSNSSAKVLQEKSSFLESASEAKHSQDQQSCRQVAGGRFTFYQQERSGGKIINICRERKPQYAGY